MKTIILIIIIVILMLIPVKAHSQTVEFLLSEYIAISEQIDELGNDWEAISELKDRQIEILIMLREMERDETEAFIERLKADLQEYNDLNIELSKQIEDMESYSAGLLSTINELNAYIEYNEKLIDLYETKIRKQKKHVIFGNVGLSYKLNWLFSINYLNIYFNWFTFGGGLYYETSGQFGIIISLGVVF